MEKKYFTCNNKGDVGCHDCSYEKARENLEYNKTNYPNEEWEMFEQ